MMQREKQLFASLSSHGLSHDPKLLQRLLLSAFESILCNYIAIRREYYPRPYGAVLDNILYLVTTRKQLEMYFFSYTANWWRRADRRLKSSVFLLHREIWHIRKQSHYGVRWGSFSIRLQNLFLYSTMGRKRIQCGYKLSHAWPPS